MDRIDKLLARIPKKHRKQLLEALDCLRDPACRSSLQATKLAGISSLYRTRAGRYRVFFHIDQHNRAIVEDIRPRNESTYRNI